MLLMTNNKDADGMTMLLSSLLMSGFRRSLRRSKELDSKLTKILLNEKECVAKEIRANIIINHNTSLKNPMLYPLK